MTLYTQEYQIAAGYNNAAGLFSLEGVIVDGEPFRPINAYGSGDAGEVAVRGDGTTFFRGFASFSWRISVVSWAQDHYIRETILGDAETWAGPVTVRTDLWEPDSFANYNAILRIAKLSDLTKRQQWFTDYELVFTRVVAL